MKKYKEVKVLIVEDDLLISLKYKNLLSNVDGFVFKFIFSENLKDGLQSLKEHSFDVLLLDLNLPDSDSQNTINEVQEISSILPIIIMTSSDDELASRKTIALGYQDFLEKSEISKKLLIKSIFFAIERFKLKNQLFQEIKKSDQLLLNILPKNIANELKAEGSVKPRFIEDAAVLFTDFKGFTNYAELVTPEQLVQDLNSCFSAFDTICNKYKIEKIKTIGDSYMAAGGLTLCKGYTKNVVMAALEMADLIKRGSDKKKAANLPFLEMRVGINNGPVIAGVVGLTKFQYDIWGDTVNVASRMESHGMVDHINISQSTFDLIKDDSDFSFEKRGEINVKGKGMQSMYFVKNNIHIKQ